MIDLLICGYNIFCHIDTIKDNMVRSKYPQDVAQLCYYFEEQKADLPDYCKVKSQVNPPRRRSEF